MRKHTPNLPHCAVPRQCPAKRFQTGIGKRTYDGDRRHSSAARTKGASPRIHARIDARGIEARAYGRRREMSTGRCRTRVASLFPPGAARLDSLSLYLSLSLTPFPGVSFDTLARLASPRALASPLSAFPGTKVPPPDLLLRRIYRGRAHCFSAGARQRRAQWHLNIPCFFAPAAGRTPRAICFRGDRWVLG